MAEEQAFPRGLWPLTNEPPKPISKFACEVEAGKLLAALFAAVPESGRILEIGTCVGVGLA
jgi:predicted O-methyltransferase YrrM